MLQNEMRDLEHGQKIKGPDGTIYIVHNNYTSGEGMIVATRSVVILYKAYRDWKKIGIFDTTINPGIYEVIISKKLD